MKALVYGGKGIIRYEDVSDPVPGPGTAIVRIAACGICGSDMHGYHGHDSRRVPPMVMGHEMAGTVEAGTLAGKRVAINPLLTCGKCDPCVSGRPQLCDRQQNIGLPPHPGGFADRIAVPEANLVPIPDGLDFPVAALAEPLAVAYHAIGIASRMAQKPLAMCRIAVLGGGAIGLAVALIVASQGAPLVRLADVNAGRRATAAAAHSVIEPYAPADDDEPGPGSMDIVFDAVGGAATREAAFRMTRRGGTIIHLGLLPGSEGVDVRRLTLNEIAFAGSYCYSMTDFRDCIALLAGKRLGPLNWVEERPMADGARAFDDIDRDRVSAAKVVLLNEVAA